ncbi:hypothetical protein Q3G72_003896 [Acer saccharum]|nr:hypothetical protein Q3G72_003896 [Acer saccharum]
MGLGDDLVKDVSDLVKDLDERSDLGSLGVKRGVLECGRWCGACVSLVVRRKSEGRRSSARPAATFCPSCAGVAPVTGAGRQALVPASAPQLLPFGSNAPFVA